jgi:hypothetical protein
VYVSHLPMRASCLVHLIHLDSITLIFSEEQKSCLECCLVRYDVVYSGRWLPVFRKNIPVHFFDLWSLLDRTSTWSGWCFWFVIWGSLVQLLASSPALLTPALRNFCQSLQAKSSIELRIGHCRFLRNSFHSLFSNHAFRRYATDIVVK